MNKAALYDFCAQTESPLYIFDSEELLSRIEAITKRLPKNAKLCYAIKANPFIVNVLKDSDIFFEVCSPGELSICQSQNLDSSKIVFSGVCKTYEDITRAYDLNVNTITLESLQHCDSLLNVAAKSEKPHKQDVIIRLTSGNQFGMSKDDVDECILRLSANPLLHLRGIHYFTGTQKKLSRIKAEIDFITEFCTALKKKYSFPNLQIEYGPGLSFDYFSTDKYSENYDDLDSFSSMIQDKPFDFVVEMGRFVASSCGYYTSRIMDIKSDPETNQNYIIIDGGINHINYYGQMMGMKIPQTEHLSTLKSDNITDYTICGSLCTTADIVIRKLPLASPKIGDILLFSNIGAYSITEGIYLFLSHPLPQVFLYKNGSFCLQRKTIESYKINMKSEEI